MEKTLDIYTCRVQDHHRLKRLGIAWLDTTVKTGTSIYAPTWTMVQQWKAKQITDREYTVQYIQRMQKSFNHHSDQWLADLDSDRLILGCFCPPNTFCHRRLLAQMFVRVARAYTDTDATYHGEYPLPPKD